MIRSKTFSCCCWQSPGRGRSSSRATPHCQGCSRAGTLSSLQGVDLPRGRSCLLPAHLPDTIKLLQTKTHCCKACSLPEPSPLQTLPADTTEPPLPSHCNQLLMLPASAAALAGMDVTPSSSFQSQPGAEHPRNTQAKSSVGAAEQGLSSPAMAHTACEN